MLLARLPTLLTFITLIALRYPNFANAQDYAFAKDETSTNIVQAQIVSDWDSISDLASRPSKKGRIGVQFRIKPGWHIYWVNSGDAGLPTKVEWNAAEDLSITSERWPAPFVIKETSTNGQPDLTTFGYIEEVVCLFDAELTNNKQGEPYARPITLEAHISWLACKEMCVPGSAEITRKFPFESIEQNTNNLADSQLMDRFDLTTPKISSNISQKIISNDTVLYIELTLPIQQTALPFLPNVQDYIQIFPHSSPFAKFDFAQINMSQPSISKFASIQANNNNFENKQITIILPFELMNKDTIALSAKDVSDPIEFSGIVSLAPELTNNQHTTTFTWQSTLNKNTAMTLQSSNKNPSKGNPDLQNRILNYRLHSKIISDASPPHASITMIVAIVFGFLGGILLNVMPCVLPVLAIKVMAFIEQAGASRIVRFSAAGWYTAGVLFSFLMFATIVVSLQTIGHQVGWGFQFQHPIFVFGLIVFVFVVALGFFEIYSLGVPKFAYKNHISLNQSESRPQNTYSMGFKNFTDGILTTILATPCSAPFLGTALAFAFSQKSITVYLVFLSIGTGLAMPFVILCLWDNLLSKLPKAGTWMYKLREGMGLILFSSIIWLLYVLDTIAPTSLIPALSVLLCIYATLWAHNAINACSIKSFQILMPICWIACICATLYGFHLISKPVQIQQTKTQESVKSDIIWQPYSDDLLSSLRKSRTRVFIDFTAVWCLTCQANKQFVLNTPEVLDMLRKEGFVTLRADWSNGDSIVSNALKQFGGQAVPYYVMLDETHENKIILPTILSKSKIEVAISAINSTSHIYRTQKSN